MMNNFNILHQHFSLLIKTFDKLQILIKSLSIIWVIIIYKNYTL